MKATTRHLTLCCLAVLTTVIVLHTERMALGDVGAGAPDDAFRVVPMAKRAGEYSELQLLVIHARDDVKRLTAGVNEATRDIRTSLRMKIDAAIDAAELDFSKEALVLLPHREGSGSNKVTFHQPVLKEGTFSCRITIEVPNEDGTDDEANYCFALAIKRSVVRKVELRVNESKTIELPILGMPSARPGSGEDRVSTPD